MTTMFLFGAGASYGSQPTGNPPLGKDLFSKLERRPGFASLSPALVAAFRKDFETGMADFVGPPGQTIEITPLMTLVREMALYFATFVPAESNAYVRLFDGLIRKSVPFTIATLNYDLLAECSLGRLGWGVSWEGPPQHPNQVQVLKPHGSCNFLPATATGITMIDCATDRPFGIWGGPLRYAQLRETLEWCRRETTWAPALCLYTRGKYPPIGFEQMMKQLQRMQSALASSDRLMILGTNYAAYDAHIWAPIAAYRGEIVVVDPSADNIKSIEGACMAAKFTQIVKGFGEAVPDILGLF